MSANDSGKFNTSTKKSTPDSAGKRAASKERAVQAGEVDSLRDLLVDPLNTSSQNNSVTNEGLLMKMDEIIQEREFWKAEAQ